MSDDSISANGRVDRSVRQSFGEEINMKSATKRLPECSGPIDRQAAAGLAFEKPDIAPSKDCPTLLPFTLKDIRGRVKTRAEDITGWKRDKIVVVGLVEWGAITKKHKTGLSNSKWAVRCDCGMYETRRYKVFYEGALAGRPDMCQKCNDDRAESLGFRRLYSRVIPADITHNAKVSGAARRPLE